MLAIKLRRIGKKHQAAFRIIVSEKRSKIDGRYVDNIGWLNPKTKEFDIKKEKAEYWIKSGACPTNTVHNLFIKAGVIQGPKISVHKKKKGGNEEPAKTEAKAEIKEEGEKPAEAAAPAEAIAEEIISEEKQEEKKEEVQESSENSSQ
jgi:small subunit ribosomal protein S16